MLWEDEFEYEDVDFTEDDIEALRDNKGTTMQYKVDTDGIVFDVKRVSK